MDWARRFAFPGRPGPSVRYLLSKCRKSRPPGYAGSDLWLAFHARGSGDWDGQRCPRSKQATSFSTTFHGAGNDGVAQHLWLESRLGLGNAWRDAVAGRIANVQSVLAEDFAVVDDAYAYPFGRSGGRAPVRTNLTASWWRCAYCLHLGVGSPWQRHVLRRYTPRQILVLDVGRPDRAGIDFIRDQVVGPSRRRVQRYLHGDCDSENENLYVTPHADTWVRVAVNFAAVANGSATDRCAKSS
jgi:hypothetical protein